MPPPSYAKLTPIFLPRWTGGECDLPAQPFPKPVAERFLFYSPRSLTSTSVGVFSNGTEAGKMVAPSGFFPCGRSRSFCLRVNSFVSRPYVTQASLRGFLGLLPKGPPQTFPLHGFLSLLGRFLPPFTAECRHRRTYCATLLSASRGSF